MDLVTAGRLARSLMDQHGLEKVPFEFDNAVKRFGCCFRQGHRVNGMVQYRPVKITISRRLTVANSEEQVRDTILHEIAHALAVTDRGHGLAWKAMARAVGARPERCYSTTDVNPAEVPLWRATCVCGREFSRVQKPRAQMRHTACGTRVPLSWSRRLPMPKPALAASAPTPEPVSAPVVQPRPPAARPPALPAPRIKPGRPQPMRLF